MRIAACLFVACLAGCQGTAPGRQGGGDEPSIFPPHEEIELRQNEQDEKARVLDEILVLLEQQKNFQETAHRSGLIPEHITLESAAALANTRIEREGVAMKLAAIAELQRLEREGAPDVEWRRAELELWRGLLTRKRDIQMELVEMYRRAYQKSKMKFDAGVCSSDQVAAAQIELLRSKLPLAETAMKLALVERRLQGP